MRRYVFTACCLDNHTAAPFQCIESGDSVPAMSVRATICRLIAFLALTGLVLGPFARPAEALAPAAAEQADMAMPDGMPCCPDEMPMKDCAKKDCPLMNVCMATALQALLPATALNFPQLAAVILHGTSDAGLSGLASGPPPRPPRA